VRRSTIISGVTLALGAATLAGVGEWASGGFRGLPGRGDAGGDGTYSERPTGGAVPAIRSTLPGTTLVPPEYTIRRTVPEVRLQFTVADENGKPVQGLSASDIRITEDQSPIEQLQDFTPNDNLPLRLGILLDASDSVKKVLPDERATALSFLQTVLKPQTDRAFVMAFGTEAKISQGTTNALPQLVNAVDQLTVPSWGTNLYDALYTACFDHLYSHHEAELSHRAIVLLSDGEDTLSLHTLDDAIAVAQRSETQIYGLALHPRNKVAHGDSVMQRLADETGGRFFVASSSKDLQRVFADIEQEMRSQYFVAFRPQQAKPGFHALHVELRAPQKFKIHARQGYYAAAN
jgi:VWFA-related protein